MSALDDFYNCSKGNLERWGRNVLYDPNYFQVAYGHLEYIANAPEGKFHSL